MLSRPGLDCCNAARSGNFVKTQRFCQREARDDAESSVSSLAFCVCIHNSIRQERGDRKQ